jgi:tRNA threonylcarbamoyladenosine biosynthesis protein TsaE
MNLTRSWKKVFESDLSNISIELKEVLQIPCILFLEGPVGAGKTTFTKIFIENKNVQSPTYSLINEYESILHADFYRLEQKEEIVHLEIPMYIEEKDYFLIEWGLKFQTTIERIVGDEFKSYLLKIDINDPVSNAPASRNYSLFKI